MTDPNSYSEAEIEAAARTVEDCLASTHYGTISSEFFAKRVLSAVPRAPEGFVLVPVEPTKEMLAKFNGDGGRISAEGTGIPELAKAIYCAMIAARPK